MDQKRKDELEAQFHRRRFALTDRQMEELASFPIAACFVTLPPGSEAFKVAARLDNGAIATAWDLNPVAALNLAQQILTLGRDAGWFGPVDPQQVGTLQ